MKRLTAAVLVLLAWAAPVQANGWEHNAIPFAALVAALAGEDAFLRGQAAFSLGVRGEASAVGPLLARLQAPEPAPGVRRAIYRSLGGIGDARAIDALRQALASETREELRAEAVEALGRIGTGDALPAVLGALADDPSIVVRSRAVDALGGFGDPRAVAVLSALALGDGGQALRPRAVRALGRTGAAAAAAPLLTVLEGARSDRLRLDAIDALARLGAPEARPVLEALLAAADDPVMRVRLTVALSRVRDGSAFATLVGLLADPLPAVRYFALDGLIRSGDAVAAGQIGALYGSVAGTLAARDPVAVLDDPGPALADLGLMMAALRALLALDPSAGLDAFLDGAAPRAFPRDSAAGLALAEGAYELRRLALVGLGYTGAGAAATALVEGGALSDPDPRLRAAAVRAIGVLGFPGAAGAILPALDDTSSDVRRMVAVVLGRLADARVVAALMAALDDPHAGVRREAALGLGYLGDARARSALEWRAEADADAAVRAAARASLGLLD